MDYEPLRQYATPRQIEFLDAFKKYGTYSAVAEALNISTGTLSNSLALLRAKGAKMGWSPEHDMTRRVPEGFRLKGTSTYYNKDGEMAGQWVKTQVDAEEMERIAEAAREAFCDTIPRVKPVAAPPSANNKLLNCYVITDYHLGALCWAEETGANWNLQIAEELLVKWFEQAIAQSPHAEYAVFAQLSDFLHSDGLKAVTPMSGHLLDVDSRFAKVVRVAIRVLRRVIDMLLAKYKLVRVIMADANHDPVSQIWLRESFAVQYENEPRISVDRSPRAYNAVEFGNTALFFHHGHRKNVRNVAEVFVSDFRETFGRVKYAYAHTGHYHSEHVIENTLMIVEQHPTLTAPDDYSARSGYRSGRKAKVITYHRAFGEVSRLTINSDMLL